jgi:hypothetical protein
MGFIYVLPLLQNPPSGQEPLWYLVFLALVGLAGGFIKAFFPGLLSIWGKESEADNKLTNDVIKELVAITQKQLEHSQEMHRESETSLKLALSALSDSVNNPRELELKIEAVNKHIESVGVEFNVRVDGINQRLRSIEDAVKAKPKKGSDILGKALDEIA